MMLAQVGWCPASSSSMKRRSALRRQASSHSGSFFFAEMNRTAARLKLSDTRYANPHGLTARDGFFARLDLQTGGSAQIGGVSNSDRVTQPVFNRAGTKVALGIGTATETAIYEASVDNPTVLTRVGAAHEGRVRIGNLSYAADDRIVYTADVRAADDLATSKAENAGGALVGFDDRDVVTLCDKDFCEVTTDLAGPDDYNIHLL